MKKLKSLFMILVSMLGIQSAFAQDESSQTFVVIQSDMDYQVWLLNLDSPQQSEVISSFPLQVAGSFESFLPQEEVTNLQAYSQASEKPFVVDITQPRTFEIHIGDSSISSDGTFVALVLTYTHCLSEFNVPDSCFGMSEIITIDTTGQQVVLSQIGFHSTNPTFILECVSDSASPFYSVQPKLLGWTWNNQYLLVSTQGRGTCYENSTNYPIVAIATSTKEPLEIASGQNVLVSPDNQSVAISQVFCSSSQCDSKILIYSLSNLSSEPTLTYELLGFTTGFLYWDTSSSTLVLYGSDTRIDGPREKFLLVDTQLGDYSLVERDYLISKASMSENYALVKDDTGKLHKVSIINQELSTQTISVDPIAGWTVLPDQSILIKQTTGEFFLVDVNQGLMEQVNFNSSNREVTLDFQ